MGSITGELGGKIMKQFADFRQKMYLYLKENGKEKEIANVTEMPYKF